MENKKCTKCLEEKPLNEYYKQPKSSDGYKTICKSCGKIVRRIYQKLNRVKLNEKQKNYTKIQPDKIKKTTKKWRDKNKEIVQKNNKVYRENNPSKIALLKKKWNAENKEKIKEKQKEYYKKNKEAILKKNREWNKDNAHIVGWRSVLKSQLRRFGKKKEGRTIDLLGYSAEMLKLHIQSLFTEGMSWENHGEWEIDHIKPVSSFDKDTPSSVVNALSNLQPLWRTENRTKFNK
jgi:hypothetical protein